MTGMSSAQVRVADPILSTIVRGYTNAELVGEALFPEVDVDVGSGQVIEFGKESFKEYNTSREPGTATKRVQFGYEGKPFALGQNALEAVVPREHMRDAARVPSIDMAREAITITYDIIALGKEIKRAGIATNASNFDGDHKVTLSGSTKWSHADGVPIDNVATAAEAVRQSIGRRPNVLMLSAVAFKAAKNNKQVVDRVKYTSNKVVTKEILAQLFEVERVEVADAVKASDAGAFSDVWGNHAILAFANRTGGGRRAPSWAYTYKMRGHPLVEAPYWDPNSKSWVYGVTEECEPVLTGMTAGYLFINPN